MVEVVVAKGALRNPDGQPAGRLVVNLQYFLLDRGWTPLAETRSAPDGRFELEAQDARLRELEVAPRLRIVGGRGEVLSDTPDMQGDGDTLFLDFGVILRGGDGEGPAGRLERAERERDALKEQNTSLSRRLRDTESALRAVESARDDLAAAVAERDARIRDLEVASEEGADVDSSIDGVVREEFARLKVQLLGAETTARVRTATVESLNARLGEIGADRDALQVELDELRGANAAAPEIGALATTIASSLRNVRAEGVVLADARITLKGYLAGAGDRFKPLDAAEMKRTGASAASEISFTVRPSDGVTNGSDTAPDLVGLTPASARRVLRPLGRRVEVTETPGTPAGAIVAQNPAAGAELGRDATIRVMVATGPAEET